MSYMKQQTATVSTKGQFVIPAEMRSCLGIEAGTRISITVENESITLRPISDRLVEETRGMLAGGPSLADALQKERRKETW